MSDSINGLSDARRRWEDNARMSGKGRSAKFTTVSSATIEMLYGPDDIRQVNFLSDIGYPGEYPYTRGIHPTGYRGKLWTMR